jgi:hypothetical protein
MRDGGLDLDEALFLVVTDRPVIRRETPTSPNRQFREPKPGELFQYTQSALDKLLASRSEGIAFVLSSEQVNMYNRQKLPSAVLALEGVDA